jgi:hypothetical protein
MIERNTAQRENCYRFHVDCHWIQSSGLSLSFFREQIEMDSIPSSDKSNLFKEDQK